MRHIKAISGGLIADALVPGTYRVALLPAGTAPQSIRSSLGDAVELVRGPRTSNGCATVQKPPCRDSPTLRSPGSAARAYPMNPAWRRSGWGQDRTLLTTRHWCAPTDKLLNRLSTSLQHMDSARWSGKKWETRIGRLVDVKPDAKVATLQLQSDHEPSAGHSERRSATSYSQWTHPHGATQRTGWY